MEVTRYTVDANCYPRFKSETRRLLDISQSLDHFWIDTFRKPYPTNVHDSKIETDLHNENVELFLCKENTAKELSPITGNDMVLQNQGVSNRGSYIYDDMKTFLAGNKHLFNSTTVMVVRNNKCLNDILWNAPCNTIILSDSSKQNLRKLEKTYEEYTHVKVSTGDKVAADICSVLERTAFEPMKDKFKSVKGLLQGISPFTRGSKSCTDVTPEIPVYNKVTLDDENMDDKATYARHTRSKAEETLRPEVKRKLYALANADSLQRNETEKGIKRKPDDFEKRTNIITNGENTENQASYVLQTRSGKRFRRTVEISQQEGGSVENQTTYLSQTRSGKLFSIQNGSVEGELIASPAKSERNIRRTIQIVVSGDLGEATIMFDTGGIAENQTTNLHQTRSGTLYKNIQPEGEYIENQAKYVRKIRSGTIIQSATGEGSRAEGGNAENLTTYLSQTRSGKFLRTPEESFRPEDDSYDFESKFIKNKPAFQRLCGEMIGMYKRSKLPEDLKPSLDVIPKEEMLTDLYNISGSIKGYAYRFGTRLQILVLEADIEKLKPKIAETLEMHGITQGSYDIVPQIDAVSPYSKLHVGAKVRLNKTNYGSLTGFVKMQQKQQGKVSCAVASKHVLDGRKIVELVNEKVNITADVVPETAPGDNHMEFDIAVAKVRKDDEKHCEGHFKNESGTFMKGMVCSYSDDQLEGQYVHINGASTANGLGIISMVHFEERKDEKDISDPNKELEDNGESNQNEKYIVVENRIEDVPFCREGDSGSMVCADDEDGNHVQLISTVIGERTTGSYQTLRLSKGISHLEKQTQSKIDFFE